MKTRRTPAEAPQTAPQLIGAALAGLAGLGAAAPVLSVFVPLFERALSIAGQYTRATQLAALGQLATVYADHSTKRAEINALSSKLYERVKADIEWSPK